jgi:hypothetical protein
MTRLDIGALCFGLVIGWITYRTLRRKEGSAALSDIATVIAAVGGAAMTALFKSEDLFSMYSIGLAVGFFLYFIVGLLVAGKDSTKGWMGE